MVARIRLKAAASAVAACLLAFNAAAQHAGRGHNHDDDKDKGSGVGAAVDGGGRLRALTAEEAQALVAGMARFVDQSDVGLKWTLLPSGAIAIDLDDRFQSVSLARLGTDGRVATQCVGTAAEARSFLAPGPRGIALERLVATRRPNAAALEEK